MPWLGDQLERSGLLLLQLMYVYCTCTVHVHVCVRKRVQLSLVWASSVGTKTCNVLIMFIIDWVSERS